jgi:GxxExxY protein
MHINKISEVIIGCAIKVHRKLGPGLLESAYHQCLMHEMIKAEINVRSQVPRPIEYDDLLLDHGYRLDLLVENQFVVELKTVEASPMCT